jgi:hypothetical protein
MHALSGTWIANVEQSKRDPNHQFERATIRFDVLGTDVSMAYGGINASGRHEQGGPTIHADGQEHPIPEAPGVVSIGTLGPRVFHTIASKDGVVVGRGAYEVAPEGETMTATVSGVDGGGRTFEQVIVFDREPLTTS